MARPNRRNAPKYAERHEVETATDQMRGTDLECRDLQHTWAYVTTTHIVRLRYYRQLHVCQRCGTERTREISETGHIYQSTYSYADGYQIKGLGRIAGEAKDALRLAAIKRQNVNAVRGKAKDEDMPRFKATRDDVT